VNKISEKISMKKSPPSEMLMLKETILWDTEAVILLDFFRELFISFLYQGFQWENWSGHSPPFCILLSHARTRK
jgi:hypothetical protein